MPIHHIATNTLNGFTAYLQVPKALFRYQLWPFLILPSAISLLLSLVLVTVIYFAAGGISGWIDGLVRIPWEWLDKTVTITTAILTFLALVAGFVFIHKHLALILLAPFLGTIAEETLKAVKGKDFVKTSLSVGQSFARSARINLQYILREMLANILFFACGFVPVIGSLISAVGMFLTQSRFLGYGLMDFPLENRGLSLVDSDAFVKERKSLSIGLGSGYLLLMMIPLVGWMFAPTFGTIAGTLKAIDELEKDSQS